MSQLLIAGVAVAGAGVIAVHPMAPALPDLQQPAVQLVGASDALLDLTFDWGWGSVLETAGHNLSDLAGDWLTQPFPILSQVAANLGEYAGLIIGMDDVLIRTPDIGSTTTSGFKGVLEGLETMFITGSNKAPGLVELLQTMAGYLQAGDPLEAFNELNLWTLFGIEGIAKPMIPVATIPVRMLENVTNVVTEMFGPEHLWDFVKSVSKAFSSPLIGVGYEFSTILGQIGTGDVGALLNAPADLTGALLNGWWAPGADEPFAGLLNAGGILDQLLVAWPQQIAEALTLGTADLPHLGTDAAALSLETLFGGVGMDLTGLFDPGVLDIGGLFTDMIMALFAGI